MPRGRWHDYGFRAILAPSFADIFFNNCFKNAILPIVLDGATVDRLFGLATAAGPLRLHVDLAAQQVRLPNGEAIGSRWTRSASTAC